VSKGASASQSNGGTTGQINSMCWYILNKRNTPSGLKLTVAFLDCVSEKTCDYMFYNNLNS